MPTFAAEEVSKMMSPAGCNVEKVGLEVAHEQTHSERGSTTTGLPNFIEQGVHNVVLIGAGVEAISASTWMLRATSRLSDSTISRIVASIKPMMPGGR